MTLQWSEKSQQSLHIPNVYAGPCESYNPLSCHLIFHYLYIPHLPTYLFLKHQEIKHLHVRFSN